MRNPYPKQALQFHLFQCWWAVEQDGFDLNESRTSTSTIGDGKTVRHHIRFRQALLLTAASVALVSASVVPLSSPPAAAAPTNWQATATFNPALGAKAVSCPSASTCVAVGLDMSARTTDGGSSWTETALRGVSGGGVTTYLPDLVDVSCPTSLFCVAVGYWDSSETAAYPPPSGPPNGGVVKVSNDGGVTWSDSLALPVEPNGPGAFYGGQLPVRTALHCSRHGQYAGILSG